MRYALLLGILLIATPLALRAESLDPYPTSASYGVLAQLAEPPQSLRDYAVHLAYGFVPPQIVLVVLAAITLFAASTIRDSEVFLILLAASPAFLATFTTLGLAPIVIALATVVAALVHKGSYWPLAAIPVFVALDATSGVLATILLVTITLSQKRVFSALSTTFLAIIACSIAVFVDPHFGLNTLFPTSVWNTALFGIAGGATVLIGFLALVGFALHYRTHKDPWILALIPLVALVGSLEYGAVIVAGLFAYYAASAGEYLQTRSWNFAELRAITLTILVCSVLFTTIVLTRTLATPDTQRIEVVRFIKDGVPPDALVWAEPSEHGVVRYAGRAVTSATLPQDASFIASSAREQNITHLLARSENPPFAHFPLEFSTRNAETYRLYRTPSEE
jgi:hypothetical protein